MIRTTVFLPEALHQQIVIVSKQRGQSLSQLVRRWLSQAAAKETKSQLDTLYSAMEEVKGVCRDKVSDASTSIDEILYGEKGAWRGDPGNNPLWAMPELEKSNGK